MNEKDLEKLERITIRIFLIAVLIWITLVIYQSCSSSITFVKGHHNTIKETTNENIEANDDQLDLFGKKDKKQKKQKDDGNKDKNKVEVISPVIDSTATDSINGSKQ